MAFIEYCLWADIKDKNPVFLGKTGKYSNYLVGNKLYYCLI